MPTDIDIIIKTDVNIEIINYEEKSRENTEN